MNLMNLQVGRVILHEVFKRDDEKKRVDPQYAAGIEVLSGGALDALRNRIVAAMSHSDRCIEMSITDSSPDSMVALASRLVDLDEPAYVLASRGVANLLANAQKTRAIPGGIVVTFTGTVGAPAKRILGVIKAEVHTGFLRDREEDGTYVLKFLDKLLLTPQTKLYKIGLFIEQHPEAEDLASKWHAFIYDESMTSKDKYGAALYFYEGFLGLGFQESSARNTKRFHDFTKGFIQSLNVEEEQKVILQNALVTYLRADQSPTVEINSFANTYLPDAELRDSYERFMLEKGFPNNAVNKDLGDIERSLRMRKLVFRNQVRLIAPSQGFDNLVKIEVIEGDADQNGNLPEWTRITVKDRLSASE